MKISTLKFNFIGGLSQLYPLEEIQSFFNLLCEAYLSLSQVEIALNPNREIAEKDVDLFQDAKERLKKFEPIQYILGETEFCGLIFKVDEHTLIPRPETEELVEWIISDQVAGNHAPRILDIGTGSGCIAVSLAKMLPHAMVRAVDISSEALGVAGKNARLNQVEIEFLQRDILKIKTLPIDKNRPSEKYDIIVSNPPYVRNLEKDQMQPNVLDYEPETALFVKDDDPLLFYKVISDWAKDVLDSNGKLYFEINEEFGNELKTYFRGKGFTEIEVKRDIFGKDRMIKCSLENS